ncbi:hypothetical protein Tco_0903730, partial [Tanacetum coccineum]
RVPRSVILLLVSSKVAKSLSLVPWAKVDPSCLAAPAAKLSLISNLWEDQALFRGGKSASRMVSLQMGDGGSRGDGILGRGDDKGDSGDGDGDGGVGATSHASMCASKDDGKGV